MEAKIDLREIILVILAIVLLLWVTSCGVLKGPTVKHHLKEKQRMIEKGWLIEAVDSIPEQLHTRDTLEVPFFIPGAIIHDTIKIECDSNKNVVIKGGKGRYANLGNGSFATSIKCPDIDSVIHIYNKDLILERERGNYCCTQLAELNNSKSIVSVDNCNYLCKSKLLGIGALVGFVSCLLIITLKRKSHVNNSPSS